MAYTLKGLFDLTSCVVKTTPEKAKEIAIIAYDADKSGGSSAIWHISSMVHGNWKCNCYECRYGFNG